MHTNPDPNAPTTATSTSSGGVGAMVQPFPVTTPLATPRVERVETAPRPIPATIRRPKPPRRAANPVFSLGVEALMCMVLLGIAALLWYWDGAFTLTFLREHFPQLGTWLAGYGQWLIPVAITILTLASWPRKELRSEVSKARAAWRESKTDHDLLDYVDIRRVLRVKTVIFTIVGAFNLGTSFSGLLIWGAGRELDLFVGLTIPTAGWGLWAFAGIVGLVCSYGPEKIARWSLGYLDRLRYAWKRGIA